MQISRPCFYWKLINRYGIQLFRRVCKYFTKVPSGFVKYFSRFQYIFFNFRFFFCSD
ncbi:unnamed protein product [Meloidogyne enterolobii]|uniref:Uncharacterized protein n=1 Tax=Meloidogyne enterolobii TaxID=390850 RepID=A0ACB0YHV2_MELEN